MTFELKRSGNPLKGTVISYDYKKGYGIILGEDKKDVLVYKKDLDFFTLLDKGDEVEYQIQQTPKGPKVVNVQILKDSLFRRRNSDQQIK